MGMAPAYRGVPAGAGLRLFQERPCAGRPGAREADDQEPGLDRAARLSPVPDSLLHSRLLLRDELRGAGLGQQRSEEHTSELQSLMRTSYAVFCLKKKTT